ncbi:hypothetical protein LJC74_03265 [Eubacteriales bacterium OttesenSCG-928-A19]|nr:hypothetical protein [Eubacteriales bacterium OttesenSCG-928-A19]
MKKLVSVLLVLLLCTASLSALAEYDTKVSFTINSTHSNASMDYNSDALYAFFAEKFNFEYDVWPVAKDAQSEKVRVWINGGTMPDTLTWRDFNTNYQEFVIYAEQGLLAPLPEGWEEAYPNLYDMVQSTGMYEKMQVDGETYAIPHATFSRYVDIEPLPSHMNVYYRKDWVEALGLEPFGTVVTMEQLKEYLTLAIKNDMAQNGNTLGLCDYPTNLTMLFTMFGRVQYNQFMRTEDGYALAAAQPGFTDTIKHGREWYADGVLDPDYYLISWAEATNNFTSGVSASMYGSCAVTSYMAYKATFRDSTGLDPDECIGVAAIAADDGTTYINETDNFWSATFFSPDIAPETFDRILSVMDYICTEEGQMVSMLGVKGETWDLDGDGNIVMLTEQDENGNYPATADLYNSFNVFRCLGILADDFGFVSPSSDPRVVEQILACYAAKGEGVINPTDYDYAFFASDNKANFSMDFVNEITRLIITPDLDIDAEWSAYLETNKAMWQPVVDDLNAAFVTE